MCESTWTGPARILEVSYRGLEPQLAGGQTARVSCWDIMLLLKLVAKTMGPTTAIFLHEFMQASGRNYDLLRLDTFNILLQACAYSGGTRLARTASEECLQLLNRHSH